MDSHEERLSQPPEVTRCPQCGRLYLECSCKEKVILPPDQQKAQHAPVCGSCRRLQGSSRHCLECMAVRIDQQAKVLDDTIKAMQRDLQAWPFK